GRGTGGKVKRELSPKRRWKNLSQRRKSVDYARCFGRRCATGSLEDTRGNCGQRSSPGWPQTSAPGILPSRYPEYSFYLWGRFRWSRKSDRKKTPQQVAGFPC